MVNDRRVSISLSAGFPARSKDWEGRLPKPQRHCLSIIVATCQQFTLRLPVWLIRVIDGCLGLFGVVCSTVSAQVARVIASRVPELPSTVVATGMPSLGSPQPGGNCPAPGGNENEEDDSRPVAAAYLRYSSEIQNDSSIDDQQRRIREEAFRLGFRLPPELQYDDHAISCTKLDRAGLQQMLADAKSSKFQVIVFLESQGIRCLSNGIQGQADAVVVRAVRRFVRVQPDPGPTRFSQL